MRSQPKQRPAAGNPLWLYEAPILDVAPECSLNWLSPNTGSSIVLSIQGVFDRSRPDQFACVTAEESDEQHCLEMDALE